MCLLLPPSICCLPGGRQICDHAAEIHNSGRLRVDHSLAQQQPNSEGRGAAAYPKVYRSGVGLSGGVQASTSGMPFHSHAGLQTAGTLSSWLQHILCFSRLRSCLMYLLQFLRGSFHEKISLPVVAFTLHHTVAMLTPNCRCYVRTVPLSSGRMQVRHF